MKIDIFFHDKFKFSFEKNLSEIYFKRLEKLPKNIISSIHSKKINNKDLKKIIKDHYKKSYLIFLDEGGKNLSSEELSKFIFSQIDKSLVFFVGGTNGFSSDILKHADLTLSLGRMTFTHSFAQIILLEQIYRSATIKMNHPYHRE